VGVAWGWGLGIYNSKHPEEAWKAIQYFTREAQRRPFSKRVMPSRRELFTDQKLLPNTATHPQLLEVVQQAVLRPPIAQYAQASDILQRYPQCCAYKSVSPESKKAAADETRRLLEARGYRDIHSMMNLHTIRNNGQPDLINTGAAAVTVCLGYPITHEHFVLLKFGNRATTLLWSRQLRAKNGGMVVSGRVSDDGVHNSIRCARATAGTGDCPIPKRFLGRSLCGQVHYILGLCPPL